MTDWMWVYENPKDAAKLVDDLTKRIAELEELRKSAAYNHETICDFIHNLYKNERSKSV